MVFYPIKELTISYIAKSMFVSKRQRYREKMFAHIQGWQHRGLS
jgi:hypothetical protein